ncbi:hypothetical protein GCM10027275_51630 [Rhabdobacter roseus]|uniref:Uncharacterized protein n=1 Tax=Rhabdobacter roseus TaxID=1655419 RepID=A0A840U4I4_9BACT|nr:glycosyl hydrolase 115 family protein [Rhabdobacter roseus]MBB5287238.1 hypothetical protein [Rhabdobacter roseus]
MRTLYLLIGFLTTLQVPVWAQSAAKSPFTLVGTAQQAVVVLPATEPACVRLAVQGLVSDVAKITGKTLRVVPDEKNLSGQPTLTVGTWGRSDAVLQKHGKETAALRGQWEAYQVRSSDKNLLIAGSDERATMFGIYHFLEKYLGVDPLYFWSDRAPEPRQILQWDDVAISQSTPSFRYRGWFINDEDLLTEWYESGGVRRLDYPYYGQVVNPAIMKQVVEALVRLRMNLIIPASFIDIRNPAEAALVQEAARRGVFLSMHHVEPMGVSAFTFFNYWQEKTGEKPLFSFYSSRQKLEEVWRVYAQEWAKYPNVIWQIGLRGIADRPMWMADPGISQSDADRGKLISEAMRVQRAMIQEVDQRPNPPITTTLWAEGSTLNQAGYLDIPKNVTVVFSDNSPGWKWQKDFHETPRRPEHTYGVYYHHQLWGAGPHLAQGIPPQHTYAVFRQAHQKQSTHYAILNVSNVREFQLGLAASGEMLYDFEKFEPGTFTQTWMQERYGSQTAAARQAYQTYFAGFVLHDRQQVPMLLDGQTRSFALGLLKKIDLQLTDPVKYQEAETKARQATTESTWGQTSLGDAHPKPANDQELLEKVLRQHQGHTQALRQAEALLPKLEAKQQAFLKTNLISQIQIMLGLEEWLVAILRAKKGLDEGHKAQAQKYLKEATDAFTRMKTGQALNVTDGKWQHWYRGEKKMNLKNAEQLTQSTYQLISQQ